MMERQRDRRIVTRRHFLCLSATAVTALAATACGGDDALPGVTPGAAPTTGTTPPTAGTTQPTAASQQPTVAAQATAGAAQRTPASAPGKYQEAPQLAALVKDGKLPPVDQRLPKSPFVVQPVERVGKYGGTWRTALLGGADTVWFTRTIAYEHLVRWDPAWEQIIPNVAEKFEASPDAKAFTFRLREGLKWSDGQPYTADDILFWYEDVELNKELTPNRGNNPPTVEQLDQHTVRFTFAKPAGFFLQTLASGGGGSDPTSYPKHYLRRFHIKYNPGGVEQLARENNAENWVKLFQLKGGNIPGTPYQAVWSNKELPRLHGWSLTTPYTGTDRVVAERNPYYFKVDPQGNQLPYLDRVVYDVVQSAETLVLKALNGEIDLQDRHISTAQNKAVFVDNMQKGGYHFFETVLDAMNTMMISLNLTHKDPVKRQVFQNQDFRIGLSHAINRQELIDVVFVGQGEPWQAAPKRETPFFNERLAKQYTEYDVKRANAHLDKAFPQKDGDGFRLGPDSRRIAFVVEVNGTDKDKIDGMNLVKGYWEKVGIDIQVKVEDRSLLVSRARANEHDAVVWGSGGGLAVIAPPEPSSAYYFPIQNSSYYAMAWYIWFTNPSGAGARTAPEEPPAATKRQMELYRQIEGTVDERKQAELMKQILQITQEQFYAIGISSEPNGYGIVKNTLKNVPAKMFSTGGFYPNPAPTNPSQYFFES